MKIKIASELEYDIETVAKSLTDAEALRLFTSTANRMGDRPRNLQESYDLAELFETELSDRAIELLLKMFASRYVRTHTVTS